MHCAGVFDTSFTFKQYSKVRLIHFHWDRKQIEIFIEEIEGFPTYSAPLHVKVEN